MKSTKQTFYYKHNRLQQLRGFCFAAQYGNITRAAEQYPNTFNDLLKDNRPAACHQAALTACLC